MSQDQYNTMLLLKSSSRGDLSLTADLIEDISRYAILSHTSGVDSDEVTFNDLQNDSGKSKASDTRIRFCREQARKDFLQHFWVDTCCIDKSKPYRTLRSYHLDVSLVS